MFRTNRRVFLNAFAVIILVALVGKYLLGLVSDMLNMRALSPAPPDEFADALDEAQYARSQRFPLRGVFVVDGSRRSSKANAFFTGFGKNKRIGLYDTLVDEYAVPELMAVLAHEVGHYKRKHILQGMAFSIVEMGVTFWILSLFLEQEQLFAAFYVSEPSVYAGLLFFGLLFTPVRLALSIPSNMLSRRNEFEADRFAAQTTGSSEPLVAALKKLSSDSLSNLTPHPLEVFLHHSHPPVLQRILALRQIAAEAGEGEKLPGSGA